MKDLQRDLEDSRTAQKEVLSSAREAERKSKAMEADIVQLHEVLQTLQLQNKSLLFLINYDINIFSFFFYSAGQPLKQNYVFF